MPQQILNKDSKDAKGIFYINNVPYHVPIPVIDLKDEERGYSFDDPKWRKNHGIRDDESGDEISSIVLHWDVCNSSRDCFRTLCRRGISGHILIDEDGSVYQTLDLAKLAYHALGWNQTSIGIFLQNPVDIVDILKNDDNNNDNDRKIVESREPQKNENLYSHLDFTNEQKEMIIKVCDILCQILPSIPKILPPLGNDGLITTKTLPRDDRIGILGNYNAQNNTLGPGDSLWVEFYRAKFPIRERKFNNNSGKSDYHYLLVGALSVSAMFNFIILMYIFAY